MRWWKRGGLLVVVLLVVALGGVTVYFSVPYHGTAASVQSVEDDPRVSVTTIDGVRVLSPTAANSTPGSNPTTGTNSASEPNSTVGLVFYPGARVAPDAYDSSLAPLVTRANVTVFVPRMPLNVALLDADAAERIRTNPTIRARHPDIRTWFVGGHSLGGVAACRYADSHDVRGLVLLASYCNANVSDAPMAVLSVTGSADTVLDRENYRQGRTRLPANATVREIRGVNHTQFGSYRGQRGDSPAPLSYDEAHRRLADLLVPWVANHSAVERASPVNSLPVRNRPIRYWNRA
ncbi:alpha/beta hydrolase [Halorussus ruber]|uniref:alpha/beta hydrolase n=1 Tax=Halorussus ruber TaxID=1126238 RepID=UPI0010925605|nr:alpha/beta hydrolase [Halorussus ruber]